MRSASLKEHINENLRLSCLNIYFRNAVKGNSQPVENRQHVASDKWKILRNKYTRMYCEDQACIITDGALICCEDLRSRLYETSSSPFALPSTLLQIGFSLR